MKKMKRFVPLTLGLILTLSTAVLAEEPASSNQTVVTDTVVTEEEYIEAVSKYEKISYSEAKEELAQSRAIARVLPESVVTISRTVYKTINNKYTLRCTAFLDVLRDNRTNEYLQIVSVRAPYVDLSGPTFKSTMSGAVDSSISGTTATVYCNGTISYSVASSSISADLPGISVGKDLTGETIYRYDVNTTFIFTV